MTSAVSDRAPATLAPTSSVPRSPAVLVVWCGHRSGPWTLRSLARAGMRVIAAHPEGDRGGRSAACRSPRPYPHPVHRPGEFLAWLTTTCRVDGVDVVLPLDEDVVRLIAEEAPDLGGAVVAGPDARQYRMLCDKLELATSAAAAGVDHPPTVEVRGGVPMGPWPPLPSIVKPRTSVSDAVRAPVVSVTTEEARTAAIAHLSATGLDAVVQEQIRGRAWVLHCVRDDAGVCMVAARVETTWPRVVGTSSVSKVTPTPPDLEAAAARLLDLVGYRGACCMNLLERDGRYWFHDINLRLAASVGAAVSAGFDQPVLGVRAALGQPVPPPSRVRAITYVPLPGELSALGAAVRAAGGESPGALLRRILRAAVGRGYTLDPPLRDPSWLARELGGAGAAAARRLSRSG